MLLLDDAWLMSCPTEDEIYKCATCTRGCASCLAPLLRPKKPPRLAGGGGRASKPKDNSVTSSARLREHVTSVRLVA